MRVGAVLRTCTPPARHLHDSRSRSLDFVANVTKPCKWCRTSVGVMPRTYTPLRCISKPNQTISVGGVGVFRFYTKKIK